MSATSLPQGRVLMPNGDFSQPWRMFMQNLYLATGGADSSRLVPSSTTVNGHPLSSSVVVTQSDVGLSHLTNDLQTKAAIVPNTLPTSGQLLVGNAGGTAYAPVSGSGDVTVDSTGLFTIGAKKVTYAQMQDVSAASVLLGRGSAAGAGSPQEITVGSGLAMTGTTLSTVNNGTVTSVSVVTANGFAGTVATPGTTPAITLTTSITGLLKGNGTAISAAGAGSDYVAPGGVLGTPSSGTLTNCTGLPAATGISGLGTGVATFLGQPTTTTTAGRLIGVQVITSTQTYTPTAGTASVVVQLLGGGGAGGGAAATAAGQFTLGAGGGAGGYAVSRLTTGFSGVTVTIGVAGAGAAGAVGGTGGTTSFGAVFSASGGTGGGASGVVASGTVAIAAAAVLGGTGTGGNIVNAAGQAGGVGITLDVAIGGRGAASFFGAGGSEAAGAPNNALALGAGGSGAANGVSSAARAGGTGGAGLCIVWEYS